MRILWLLTVTTAALAQQPAHQPQAVAPTPATPPNGGYLGSNVCKVCHADVWFNFYKNPHFKSIASGKEPPEDTGCEGCHGPGQKHVAAGGGAATIPRAFSLMPPKQVLEACLRCHGKDLTKANIQRSEHTKNDIVCTNCHSIHKSKTPKFLLAKKQNELCYTCHATVQSQFSMPSHHRVNEGFMTCSDCHNPHGSYDATWRMAQTPRMMQRVLNAETPCIQCHVEKRGPFVFEHPPVRVEGCEICHWPHGSMNSKLLRRPVVFAVCLECHNGADNFGTRNNGIPIQSSRHNMLDPKFQKCTTCHVAIHGSNNDPFFLR
jgi:DmsE family decaheme c-type cytochrome